MITAVALDLQSDQGKSVGCLTLSCLRTHEEWRGQPAILDLRAAPADAFPAAPVQLLEELSYAYEISSTSSAEVEKIEPVELFSSTRELDEGRLEARRATGTLDIRVFFADGQVGRCEVEVRSRKLDYVTEYRAMLRRIARESAELVQSAFAPSALSAFRPNTMHDPATIYQRFAFVQALLDSPDVQNALQLVQRRPHTEFVELHHTIDPARATRASAALSRQMTVPGPRQPTARPIAGLMTVPRSIEEVRSETTYDTVPNRFVKYVLTRWRNLAVDVERALVGRSSASDDRGRREAQVVAEELAGVLSCTALDDAGQLTSFPHSNQVLQGRAGYREVLEAFLLAESAAAIDWDDRDRLFSAGQRDVAALYEYWVFLELVRIVESLPGFNVDRRNLVRLTPDRLSLNLRRTGGVVVRATATRRGRPIVVNVWFNRSFPGPPSVTNASWTVSMRPDCSIQVLPAGRHLDAATWIHFDAKYRLSEVSPALDDVENDNRSDSAADSRPLSDDLKKMHAYRDAIRRTAGAYVLYPGSDAAKPVRHVEYHEILPGLGAFVLRPTDDGEASTSSSDELRGFIEDVVDHVAAQGTAAERARFWTDTTYRDGSDRRIDYEGLLTKPPKDTMVLIGFVISE